METRFIINTHSVLFGSLLFAKGWLTLVPCHHMAVVVGPMQFRGIGEQSKARLDGQQRAAAPPDCREGITGRTSR